MTAVLIDVVAAPYIAFGLLHYRFYRFTHRPMEETLAALRRPSWLAEFLLSAPLLLLGLLLAAGSGGSILGLVAPTPAWIFALVGIGGSHVASLLWGSWRGRLACAICEPWVYLCLLIAFGFLSSSPRLAVASFTVSFVVSLAIPFTLRGKYGPTG
jgi:hypothetical protein